MTKGAFAALIRVRGVPKALPRQQAPDRIRAQYTKSIQGIMAWVLGRVKAELYPQLKTLTEQASRVATTDANTTDETKITHKAIPGATRKGRLGQELRARAILWEWPEGRGFRVSVEWYEVSNGLTYGHPPTGKIFEAGQEKEALAEFERIAAVTGSKKTKVKSTEPAPAVLEAVPAVAAAAGPGVAITEAELAASEAQILELAAAVGDDAIGATLDRLRAEVAARFTRGRLTGLVDPFAEATAAFQAGQLNAQLREAVALDVVGAEPWLKAAVNEFTGENVALIRTIPARFFDEIETLIKREAADGARWETLVDGIEERYDVSRSRSKIIARDQVGKFYGDLNRVRQTDLGIVRFIWRTMRDNRVRPEHDMYDGNSYEWGSAPEGGPGEPVLCRCYADPDLNSVALAA